MPKYGEELSVDFSCLDGEEFQIALRVAVNDLRDQETIFAQFLSEAGDPDKSNWKRTVEYSHLHLLFARTIVSTLLAESDRRIITQAGSRLRTDAAISPAMRLAQGRLQKSQTANSEPGGPIPEFRDGKQIALDHHPQRNHARLHRQHEIGFAIRGPWIARRRHIENGEHVLGDATGCLERRYRWSRAGSLWVPCSPHLSADENE